MGLGPRITCPSERPSWSNTRVGLSYCHFIYVFTTCTSNNERPGPETSCLPSCSYEMIVIIQLAATLATVVTRRVSWLSDKSWVL